MKNELLIVVGIQSNYRTLLKQAIDVGYNYNFTTRILDLNALVEGWKPYPNNWEQLGLTSSVVRIDCFKNLHVFARENCGNHSTTVLFLYPPGGKFRKAWKILQSYFPDTGLIIISPVVNVNSQSGSGPPSTVGAKLIAVLRKAKSMAKPVPSFLIISGTECIPIFKSYFRSLKHTRFIHTHSLEYEFFHYGEYKPDTRDIPTNGYILVLEQGWFSKPKPDFLTDKQYPPASRQNFSNEICSLLHRLSEATKLKVIVSCHPKASIDDTSKIYKGFKVVDLPTAELIKDCSIALANTSTSIGYAVIANKPLILFTSDELSNSIIHDMEIAISGELEIDYINMSHIGGLDIEELTKQKCKDHYTQYCHRYIRQDKAPDLPLWDSIFSRLSSSPI